MMYNVMCFVLRMQMITADNSDMHPLRVNTSAFAASAQTIHGIAENLMRRDVSRQSRVAGLCSVARLIPNKFCDILHKRCHGTVTPMVAPTCK